MLEASREYFGVTYSPLTMERICTASYDEEGHVHLCPPAKTNIFILDSLYGRRVNGGDSDPAELLADFLRQEALVRNQGKDQSLSAPIKKQIPVSCSFFVRYMS